MASLNDKDGISQHYKPINKKGQRNIAYFMILIIVSTLGYILSFYL